MMQDDSAAIAVYDNHPAAEAAVRTLHDAGFDMTKLSGWWVSTTSAIA